MTGEIQNRGTFNYSGGTLISTAFTNSGTVNLSGAGTRTLAGTVTNNGTFTDTNTTVNFTGTLVNNSRYASDSSTTYAADITIGPDGYLVGGAGDRWIISHEFVNQSAMNTLWSTGSSYLGFAGGTEGAYNLYLPGDDIGVGTAGYENNFAWGTLEIDGDQDLVLYDGNTADAGGALYVGQILGLEIAGSNVLNITGNGLNIYYDRLKNPDLNGLTYAMVAGGSLIASPVPIPSTVILFASGLMGLIGLGRRRLASPAPEGR